MQAAPDSGCIISLVPRSPVEARHPVRLVGGLPDQVGLQSTPTRVTQRCRHVSRSGADTCHAAAPTRVTQRLRHVSRDGPGGAAGTVAAGWAQGGGGAPPAQSRRALGAEETTQPLADAACVPSLWFGWACRRAGVRTSPKSTSLYCFVLKLYRKFDGLMSRCITFVPP